MHFLFFLKFHLHSQKFRYDSCQYITFGGFLLTVGYHCLFYFHSALFCVIFFSLASFIAPDDKKMPKHLQFQRPFVGAIRQGTLCADSMDALEGDTVGISPCHGHGRNQVSKISIASIILTIEHDFPLQTLPMLDVSSISSFKELQSLKVYPFYLTILLCKFIMKF